MTTWEVPLWNSPESKLFSLLCSRTSRFCHCTSLHTVWSAHGFKSSKSCTLHFCTVWRKQQQALIALEEICRSLSRSWTKPKSKVIHHNTKPITLNFIRHWPQWALAKTQMDCTELIFCQLAQDWFWTEETRKTQQRKFWQKKKSCLLLHRAAY